MKSSYIIAIDNAFEKKSEITALDCSIAHQEYVSEHADWHEFSSLLTLMADCDFIKRVGSTNGGMTLYSRI
jgi:hypothetical protein